MVAFVTFQSIDGVSFSGSAHVSVLPLRCHCGFRLGMALIGSVALRLDEYRSSLHVVFHSVLPHIVGRFAGFLFRCLVFAVVRWCGGDCPSRLLSLGCAPHLLANSSPLNRVFSFSALCLRGDACRSPAACGVWLVLVFLWRLCSGAPYVVIL